MGLVNTHYCKECHHSPNSSHIISHAYVTGRTFAAYPITSALLATALIAGSVTGAVLLGTGLILPGVAVLAVAYVVGVLSVTLFFRERRNVDSEVHKETHSFDRMQNFIQKDQKVCLVLEATHDHNGALKTKGPKIWEKNFPVIHIKVSNIEEMNACIEKVSQIAKIQVLWISGHGNSNMIKLGDAVGEQIDGDNVHLLAFDKLEPDATIIASACRTAKTTKGIPFASKLSKAAKTRPVVASIDVIYHNNIILRGGKKPKIKIELHKLGKHANFLDILTPNFIGKYFRKNTMALYIDGILQDLTSYKL